MIGEIAPWLLSKSMDPGKQSQYNRQFNLDRAAANRGVARMTKKERDNLDINVDGDGYPLIPIDPNFEWRFQKFDVHDRHDTNKREISPKLGSPSDKDSIRYKLGQEPKDAERSQPLKDVFTTNMGNGSLSLNDRIVYADLRQMLEDMVSNGFNAAQEALQMEVFLGDDE